jgi:hypothetical protein
MSALPPQGLSEAAMQSARSAGGAAGAAGLTGAGLKAASLDSIKMPSLGFGKFSPLGFGGKG